MLYVKFALPEGTKAKKCKLDLTVDTLKLTVAGEVLVAGELGGRCNPDDSFWTLEDGELCLDLEKNKVTKRCRSIEILLNH